MAKKQVTLYTDGACSGNPGAGGYGGILIYGNVQKEYSGGEPLTTNNRMEVRAVIEGLSLLKYPCAVKVYSDSAYTVNAFINGWLNVWQKNGWKKADNKPVQNADLWQTLLRLTAMHEVTFHKVKGHADNPFNNRCDALARAAIVALKSSTDKSPSGDASSVNSLSGDSPAP
ncbi:MAG: ribonuclease HI [Candidatus Scatosoma sp.]